MQKGFTLIELMLVVAIVGILVSFAMPEYEGYVARSQIPEMMSFASAAQTATTEARLVRGAFPETTQPAFNVSEVQGRYIASIGYEKISELEARIRIRLKGDGSDVAYPIRDKELLFVGRYSQVTRVVTWDCTTNSLSDSVAINKKYLPSHCN